MVRDIGVYRRLLGYLRPYKKQALFAYTAMLLTTGLNLLIPQTIKLAIDRGLTAGNADALYIAGGVILGVALLRGIMAFARRYFGEWLSFRVAYDLRNDFYESVQRLPFSFHDDTQTGDLMSRVTSDISETERFVGIGMMDLVTTLLLLFGVMGAMVWENSYLAFWALLPIPLLIFATLRFGLTARPMFKKIQEQMGKLSSMMQESMTGILVVKAFAREPYEFSKFDRENEGWFDLRRGLIRVWGNNWPLFSFILAMVVFLLLWLGGTLAMRSAISVGSLFAMISYVLMLNGPVQRLGFLVNLAATAGASAMRVFNIIDRPTEIVVKPDALVLGDIQGEVTFEDVHFAYRDISNVLCGIDFKAAAGETIALIGPTGSGKSTLTNLIPRFYDVSQGRVLIDGIDVRDVTLESLRQHIGIVLQDPFLFRATIAENIAYGRADASREDIVAAAKAACAHDFITAFPDGYDTKVGERGVTLSGGQKQRVAIARALLYDPKILILDDSTSSVDTATEHLIQKALDVLMEGRTTFIIAQRLLTLKSADGILVLDEGVIVERGTHDALLAQGGLYRQIYDLQLRDQEEFLALQAQIEEGEHQND